MEMRNEKKNEETVDLFSSFSFFPVIIAIRSAVNQLDL